MKNIIQSLIQRPPKITSNYDNINEHLAYFLSLLVVLKLQLEQKFYSKGIYSSCLRDIYIFKRSVFANVVYPKMKKFEVIL